MRSRRFRCLVILGVLLAALMFGYLFRLHDVRGLYQQGMADVLALERVHEAKALEVARREPLNEALALAQARLQDARWRLSAGADMEDLLEHLAASGRTYGLTFERFEAEAPVMESDYLRFPLQMTVSGRYQALRVWLEEWGRQMRTLQFSSLSMSELDGQKGQLQLQLEVQAFHAPEMPPQPVSLADEPAQPALLAPRVDPFASWSTRQAADGLAGIPLEQLHMVGSLSRAGRTHALLVFAGRLHRVAVGDRLGRDEGLVVRVDEGRLEVQERLFVAGRWQERSRYLALRGYKDQEVMDEHKAAVGVGDEPGFVDGRVGKGL
ncbi:pilus assembly protein PilP [Pseudomonas sp. NPDC089554]|uniref:pilus assembly protein PilP n=1 Tax=Pseudomonas sp. NPDC089554 TaxID=3390653 RepID=UPI003CFF1C9E